jgi:hypothetical protein
MLLNIDHSPDNPSEVGRVMERHKRIESTVGVPLSNSTPRVCG